MQIGLWLPVYGGWLRTYDQATGPDVAACLAIAQQAEAMGFDFIYASENLLNCIHGPAEGVADAWSLLAAIAATTHRIGLCGAIKPGFRSPFLVARMLDTLSKVAKRRLAMNIVCGWWKEEFRLSSVDWLDHDGRYDRAEAFIRTLHELFRPSVKLDASMGDDERAVGRFPTRDADDALPSYGLDEDAFPEVWIAGHSPRAIHAAAEWGECLYLNGMSDTDLRDHIARARQQANRWGRRLSIAANAYVIAMDGAAEARQRWKAIQAKRNSETIAFFRALFAESGASAWDNLGEEEMVDSNAGFKLGLIGSFGEVGDRILALADLGVDRIVCQFDDPMRDAGPFMRRVVRPIQSKLSAFA